MLFPALLLSSVPLRGMTFPFLSDRNPLSTPLNQTSRRFLFPKLQTSHVFRFCAAVFLHLFIRLKSLFAACFSLCVNSVLYSRYAGVCVCLCMRACVRACVHVCAKILSTDKILHCINTLIIIIIKYHSQTNSSSNPLIPVSSDPPQRLSQAGPWTC